MLYGGVNYKLKANPENEVHVPWAGRVVFAPAKEGEAVKMQFYQVYLVRFQLNELESGMGGMSWESVLTLKQDPSAQSGKK